MAVPVRLVNHVLDAASLSTNPKVLATVDLILIAFYFLLRVGEYMAHGEKQNR